MTKEVTRFVLEQTKQEVKATPDTRFNYKLDDAKCGCVLPIMRRLLKLPKPPSPTTPLEAIGPEFGLSTDEARYIGGWESPMVGNGKSFSNMTNAEATGARGKREAVRRINVVLKRHQ